MSAAVQVFRVLAASTSALMILSPVPTMCRIMRAKVVGHNSIVPLVSMLANSHMNMLYGLLVHNIFPIFATFAFGVVASLTYIAIFYRFTHDRATAHKALAVCLAPLALVSLYAVFGPAITGQTSREVGVTIGYLRIISTLVLYSAPFEKIRLVLRHRTAVFLDFPMVLTGAVTNSTWVTYGALVSDWLVFAPNVFTVLAGLVQLALCIIYSSRTLPLTEEEEDASGDCGSYKEQFSPSCRE